MTYITGGAVQLSGTTSLLDLPGISTPTLSASNHGKIYFDSTSFTFKASLNGGSYSTFGVTPPAGSNTQLQFNNSGSFGASSGLTWNGTTLTATNISLTNPLPVASGGTALSSTPTNGQLLIGNGTNYTLATITGTTNQISVATGVGSITLSTPQSINTSAAVQFGTLGLGSAVVASSILSLTSTTAGFLPPRLTTTQRDAVSSPATGLQIYNTTTNQPEAYNGTAWAAMGGGSLPTNQQYTAGTPSGTYSGSLTVFDLPFSYTTGGNGLMVFSSGILMGLGASNDYLESSTTQITFNFARTSGEVIRFVKFG